ncbi:MAG: OsmC family protein [Alicyclobacillaceae bacterium]|nr:OsmC family protein [Alicyclobacillaceae bacterium]
MSEKRLILSVNAESSGLKTEFRAGRHQFIIDEPPTLGGSDAGANPLEYVLGALAGCENVVANFVARELDFRLESIRFEIKGDLDLRGLMGEPNVRTYFQRVIVRVWVKTPEPEERVKVLQETVDRRCPVFNLLRAAGVELDVEWAREAV